MQIWLDRDDEGFDGTWLATVGGATGSASIPLPERLQDCAYRLYALRSGPSGFGRDYAPETITLEKSYLQPPTGITAERHHRWGRTHVTWTSSVDDNAMGYAIYVRDRNGNDSMYVAAFRDQVGATLDIEDYENKSIYIITFDEEGRRGCPSPIAAIALSDVESEPARGAATALELSAVPNPSSGRTRIGFTLGTAAPVKLVVHDLDGREVAVLAERRFEAGPHALIWNADGVAAGAYIVTITAADRTEALVTVVIH